MATHGTARALAQPIEIVDSITHRRIDGGTPKQETGLRDPVWRTSKQHRTNPRHLLVLAYGKPCALIPSAPSKHRGKAGFHIKGPHADGQIVCAGSGWKATVYAHPPDPSEAQAEQLALFGETQNCDRSVFDILTDPSQGDL